MADEKIDGGDQVDGDAQEKVTTLPLDPEVIAHVREHADEIRADLEKLRTSVRTEVRIQLLGLLETSTLVDDKSFNTDRVSEVTGITDADDLRRLVDSVVNLFRRIDMGTFVDSALLKPEGHSRMKAFYNLSYKDPVNETVNIDTYPLPEPVLKMEDEQIEQILDALRKVSVGFGNTGKTGKNTVVPFLAALMKAVERGRAADREFIDLHSRGSSLAAMIQNILKRLKDPLAQKGIKILFSPSRGALQPVLISMLKNLDYQEVMPQDVMKFLGVIDQYLSEGETPSYLADIIEEEECDADGEVNYRAADFSFDLEHFKSVCEHVLLLPLGARDKFPHREVLKMVVLYSVLGRQISKAKLIELVQTIDPKITETAVDRAIKQISGFLSIHPETKTFLKQAEEDNFFYFEAGGDAEDVVTGPELYEFCRPGAVRMGPHAMDGKRVRRLMPNSRLFNPFSTKLRPLRGEILVVLVDDPDPEHKLGKDNIRKIPFGHLNLIEE